MGTLHLLTCIDRRAAQVPTFYLPTFHLPPVRLEIC